MNNQPIGILDSGVGGLSIWKEIVLHMPHESTVYIADSLNCPYGNKDKEEIYRLARKLVGFLVKNNAKLVIVACNTITVSCLGRLRLEFKNLPIVGAVPVVKTLVENTRNKKIGILSTTATAKSEYQKELIKVFANKCEVVNIGMDKLVPLIEKGEIGGSEIKKILKDELNIFKNAGVDSLALGCTHFPFLKKEIQNFLGLSVLVFDSGGAIARQVKRVLTNNDDLSLQKKPEYSFYTTGNTQLFTAVVKKLIGENFVKKAERALL